MTLLLVRIHCGPRNNIDSDRLARIEKGNGGHKNPEHSSTPWESEKKLIPFWIFKESTRHWKEVLGILHTRAFIEGHTPQISRTPIGLNRKRLRLTIWTLFHSKLRGHLRPRCLLFMPIVRFVEDTPLHFESDCSELKDPRLRSIRSRSEAGPILKNVGPEWLFRFGREIEIDQPVISS